MLDGTGVEGAYRMPHVIVVGVRFVLFFRFLEVDMFVVMYRRSATRGGRSRKMEDVVYVCGVAAIDSITNLPSNKASCVYVRLCRGFLKFLDVI